MAIKLQNKYNKLIKGNNTNQELIMMPDKDCTKNTYAQLTMTIIMNKTNFNK